MKTGYSYSNHRRFKVVTAGVKSGVGSLLSEYGVLGGWAVLMS